MAVGGAPLFTPFLESDGTLNPEWQKWFGFLGPAVDASTSKESILTAKGDLLTFAAALARLAVGSNGQVLTADSTQTNGIKWASGTSVLTTKGDLLGFSTVLARLAVGTDGQALLADSTQTLGIKWGSIVTAYAPQVPLTASRTMNGVSKTTVANVTEAGLLNSIAIIVTANTGGTFTASLDITVDGGSTFAIPLYLAGANFWEPSICPYTTVLVSPAGTQGNTAQDALEIPFMVPYKTSLKVEINQTANAAGAGVILAVVNRSKQI